MKKAETKNNSEWMHEDSKCCMLRELHKEQFALHINNYQLTCGAGILDFSPACERTGRLSLSAWRPGDGIEEIYINVFKIV